MPVPDDGQPPEEKESRPQRPYSPPIAAAYDLGAPPGLPDTPEEEPRLGGRSINLYLPFGLGLAVLGLAVPLLFGPFVTMIGLQAWNRHRDKAWLVIVAGVLLIVHGLVYYRLATAGGVT